MACLRARVFARRCVNAASTDHEEKLTRRRGGAEKTEIDAKRRFILFPPRYPRLRVRPVSSFG